MMKLHEKYSFQKASEWVGIIDDKELVSTCVDDEKDAELKKNAKGFCYINKDVIRISNSKTERYSLKAWNLNAPETLQSISSSDIFVQDNQYVVIHRLGLIRDGKIISKNDDTEIRVIDDERSSHQGFLSKIKKVHLAIPDLRLNDTFIFEYTVVTIFNENDVVGKKYFGHVQLMPSPYWFYKRHDFKFIQDRDENIRVAKKYFRDEKGIKIDTKTQLLKKGDSFDFNKINFQRAEEKDVFIPYFEFASDASWINIADYISGLYKKGLTEKGLAQSDNYKSLQLTDDVGKNIRKIIEFVQDQIVYLYDAEVMHGNIPQSALQTLEQKSGDCKAKSLLLVNLLKTINVDADIILVNYSQDLAMLESLPTPFIFNHVIVRISYQGAEYFVDPTQTNKRGLLPNRAEPFFANFLAIKEGADLSSRPIRKSSDENVEEEITIHLGEKSGTIAITRQLRHETADTIRGNFKRFTSDQLIKDQNSIMVGKMMLNSEKNVDDFFKNAEYRVVSDDQDANILTVEYKAELTNPYGDAKNSKIFRYYTLLNIDPILRHKHKDSLCYSFYDYPTKSTLNIKADNFIARRSTVTRQTEIDNKYFKFSNKKKISFHTVTVVSEFTPKIYGYIENTDLEAVKGDYKKINDSNFGVGIVLTDFGHYLLSSRYLRYALPAIVIATAIYNITSGNGGGTSYVAPQQNAPIQTIPIVAGTTSTNPDLNQAIAYDDQGKNYINQGDYKSAIDVLNKSIQADPYYYQAYSNLAFVYTLMHDQKSADLVLQQAKNLGIKAW